MERLFIITGADGHLGGTLIRLLRGGRHRSVVWCCRAICPLPGTASPISRGTSGDKDSLRPLFEGIPSGTAVYLIHTAGIVDISGEVLPLVRAVNVDGTKNVLSLCREYAVQRLVYVSSVHAIPEGDKTQVLHEIRHFDPDAVVGGLRQDQGGGHPSSAGRGGGGPGRGGGPPLRYPGPL